MSETNGDGVIRVGRKGRVKFAFGEDGEPFEVDVVVALQQWSAADEKLRGDDGVVPTERMPQYHATAVEFAEAMSGTPSGSGKITVAEALDFIARLREQYDEVADFFRPKSRAERGSPGITATQVTFSEEES